MLPGQTLRATVTLSGAATGTPTAKLLHNTVNDAGVTPTVSAGADANQWAVSAVIPGSGYVAGDTVELSVTATVSGVTGSLALGRATIDNPATLAPAGLDAIVIEAGINLRQALSGIFAALVGLVSGAGTGTVVVKGGGVSTTRMTADTDAAGNRSSVTLNLPA